MKKTDLLRMIVVVAGISMTASVADANPKFAYGKKADLKGVKKTVWKASAQAGMVVSRGNSEVTTFAGGAKASRKQGNNKLAMEASGTYARSTIFVINDFNGNMLVDPGELVEQGNTSSKAWLLKSRYDRFLTKMNSLYVTASVSGDEPAGKEFVGGGQAGYSRQLYATEKHTVVGEGGYDFSYEDLVVGDPVSIHSLRVFAGYEGKLSKMTGLSASLEVLDNLNELSTANGIIDPFDDLRVNGTLALTTQLRKQISFRFGFTGKYDNAPAPRGPIAGVAYAPGFVPRSRKIDTITEASLIINFL